MGYENKDFQNGGLKFAMSLVHADHVKVYNRHVLPLMFKYYSIYAFKGKVKDLVFSYTFRIKRNDGEYIWALHYMNSIKVNKWGFPILTMVNITDITAHKKDDNIDFSVSVKDDNAITKTILSRIFPAKSSNIHFSEREIEILSLMAQGKRSKEIAEGLCISKHTVSTHRKNMMDKANVKNSYELIHLARTNGLIVENKLV
jgi:DNA-binding CsgD family transcriptional regulator